MLNKVNDLVIRGKAKLITGAVAEALEGGCVPEDILNTMIAGMDVVGERFKNGEIFVPEMLIAAKAMKKGVEVLKPHLASGAAGALGKVVIGTVAGDLHDIGKNLVDGHVAGRCRGHWGARGEPSVQGAPREEALGRAGPQDPRPPPAGLLGAGEDRRGEKCRLQRDLSHLG